jgi:hypothetical protein
LEGGQMIMGIDLGTQGALALRSPAGDLLEVAKAPTHGR